jgi:Putative beta-barrel porin-2, OmpL-like. bbp2
VSRKLTMLQFLLLTSTLLAQIPKAEDSTPPSDPVLKYAPTGEPEQTQHWGAVNPENLPQLFSSTNVGSWMKQHRVRYYGWVDGGGQYVSTGSGELPVGFSAPNRFADGLIVDAGWIIVERPLAKHSEGWDWGFRGDFYAGQDAALLRPMNSFGPQGPRLGTDFRQAFLSLHIPIITKGGLDLQLGRQNVPIGYETLMAPYRPLYTQTYYWIFHQVAATGIFGTLHAAGKLDLVAGADLNYNTVFKLRGRAPSYLAKAIYSLSASHKTTVIGDVYTGPQPVPTLAGHSGSWQTLSEFEVRHDWSPRVFQIVQGSYEWDCDDPATKGKTSTAQGAFSMVTVHLSRQTLDLNLRGEWMHDVNGIRTHFPGIFGESTVGLNVMPKLWMTFRPEIRGDFASAPFLGPVDATIHRKSQLTAGGDLIFKF